MKTLVLPGVSIHMITLLGALDYLNDNQFLNGIGTFVGTSSGAICSYLLAIGYTPFEIMVHLRITNVFTELKKISLKNMVTGKGAVDFNVIRDELEKMTIKKVNQYLTLKQLYKLYGKHLVCCTYNLSKHIVEYISFENYPDMPCMVALQMSANIPLVFSDFKYFGDYYIDGGVLDKFPLGHALSLGTENTILSVTTPPFNNMYNEPPSSNLLNYVHDIASITLDNSLKKYIKNTPKGCEIYVIESTSHSSFDFNIDKKKITDMFVSGRNQMKLLAK